MSGLIIYGLIYKIFFVILVAAILNVGIYSFKIWEAIKNYGKGQKTKTFDDMFKNKTMYFIYLISWGYIVATIFTGIGVLR